MKPSKHKMTVVSQIFQSIPLLLKTEKGKTGNGSFRKDKTTRSTQK